MEGVSSLTVALTVLHAGKFGSGGYKVSGGLHGVGSSVVSSALSARMIAEVRRDGGFRSGRASPSASDAQSRSSRPPADRHRDHLLPERRHLRDDSFNYETLATQFRGMAFLNKGLRIEIVDRRKDRVDEHGEPIGENFVYEDGLVDFVKHLNASQDALSSIIDVEAHSATWAWASGWRCSGTPPATATRCTPSPTPSTHTRPAPRRGPARRAGADGEQWGGELAVLIEGGPGRQRGHPPRPDRDPVSEDRRTAVRGPDQDQAQRHAEARGFVRGRQRPAG